MVDEHGKRSSTRIAGLTLVFLYVALALLDVFGLTGTLEFQQGLVTLILGLFGFAGARSGLMTWRSTDGDGSIHTGGGAD